jgi:sodium/hydrogen antiporter
MTEAYWFTTACFLLVGVVLASTLLGRLPISTSIIYLGVGMLLGPGVLGMLSWDAVREAEILKYLTEIAVIVSLFTVGLKWRTPLTADFWSLPVRLATVGMVLTIAAVTLIGTTLLALPLGAAVLLGAVLAPTDPVLASEVQVRSPTDRDSVRYALSGEAGLNDGLAFPFVMLGLGLLGLHPDEDAGLFKLWAKGEFGMWGWVGWDLIWAVVVGLAVGSLTGNLVGRLALHLHQRRHDIFALHEFLVLGLIALSYGLAELIYGYGFLAVFAGGYALRRIELRATDYAPEPSEMPPEVVGDEQAEREVSAKEPEQAAQRMATALMTFNDQLERILEAAVVVLLGAVLTTEFWAPEVVWLAPLLFLVVRPLSVAVGLIGKDVSRNQKALVGWFGIRGIGSIYYLTYALAHGVTGEQADRLTALVLSAGGVVHRGARHQRDAADEALRRPGLRPRHSGFCAVGRMLGQ